MSDLKVDGFKSSEFIAALGITFAALSEKEKKDQINKVKGVFEIKLKNAEGTEETWTIDLKNEGKVTKGASPVGKPNITLTMADETFSDLAAGKTTGQKAFMSGKLKAKGNIMLATKLDGVLKTVKAKL
ncbi:sterol-binding-like protein [Cylindrobasidium torrendii FP15055 ss-10]|uniref:Sterol-binding-like protein n=1 Tax=Cylindrobasidium torrendii FP15055 ss-10 TaxID=1314674 RepID=A0A0D7BGS4_9AGAR|nr:sterol-binding-like protein [Cylindrobasidium torrendii FP15055 ss-10]